MNQHRRPISRDQRHRFALNMVCVMGTFGVLGGLAAILQPQHVVFADRAAAHPTHSLLLPSVGDGLHDVRLPFSLARVASGRPAGKDDGERAKAGLGAATRTSPSSPHHHSEGHTDGERHHRAVHSGAHRGRGGDLEGHRGSSGHEGGGRHRGHEDHGSGRHHRSDGHVGDHHQGAHSRGSHHGQGHGHGR